MKQGLRVIMGLLLVVLAVCSCGGAEEQERSATLIEVVNKVDAHARPQDDWGPAGLGMVVYGGGRVREDSRLVTIGSSVGADGAVYACGQEKNCVGALSFSAGGYLDVPFADLVATTVEQGKYVWAVMAQDDAGATRLARTEWGDYYREIVITGSAHGDQLYDADTGKIIQDFIDCATHSFELEKCVGF